MFLEIDDCYQNSCRRELSSKDIVTQCGTVRIRFSRMPEREPEVSHKSVTFCDVNGRSMNQLRRCRLGDKFRYYLAKSVIPGRIGSGFAKINTD